MDKKEKLWYDIMVERGHTPIMDEYDGEKELNYFVYDYDHHNGPGCSVCNWSVCWHCEPDPKTAIPLQCIKVDNV